MKWAGPEKAARPVDMQAFEGRQNKKEEGLNDKILLDLDQAGREKNWALGHDLIAKLKSCKVCTPLNRENNGSWKYHVKRYSEN